MQGTIVSIIIATKSINKHLNAYQRLMFFDAVCKTAVISLLTQKKYQDVQLELFHHQHKFHPDQVKSVWKKLSQQVLLCADLVTPRQGQGQWKQNTMVEVNGTNKHAGILWTNLVEHFVNNVQR